MAINTGKRGYHWGDGSFCGFSLAGRMFGHAGMNASNALPHGVSPRDHVVADDLAHIVRAPLPWQRLAGRSVLITGAAGFLPAYMVETLLYLNDVVLTPPARIIGLVRNRARARERFRVLLDRPDFDLIEQDVSCSLTFEKPIDFIIHAASPASPAHYLADPVGTLSANVLGTLHLLRAAQRYNATFLYFSSGAVYGDVSSRTEPIAEHDMGPLDPANERACYEESKRMGETMCVAWARQFGVPTRIVRPWHTYGPGMRLNDDGRVFADFVRDILAGGPIVLQSDGLARRCFCYLADATLGFFTVLLRGGDGEAYNVANPDGESGIRELADRLAAIYHRDGIRVATASQAVTDNLPVRSLPILPNIAKLADLGWQPTFSIEDGFKRTIDSYRA